MSTTDTTRTDDAGIDSVWGAPPPTAAVPSPVDQAPAQTLTGTGRRRIPDTVRTKVAALLAAAGLVVGGAAGVAVGHGSSSGTQTPTGQNGQFGPGQQGGQGGPPGLSGQQGQQGTTQQGTVPNGTTQQGTVPDGTTQQDAAGSTT
jgi:hypothetical protein